MSKLLINIKYYWNHELASQWSTIIPALLVAIIIIWLLTVYRNGGFRFQPAFAIARVTVLDSIGRMEVIILLSMGMMFVGVNVILPNTAAGNEALLSFMPMIGSKIDDYAGITDADGNNYLVPEDQAGRGWDLSVGESDISGQLSTSEDESVLSIQDDENNADSTGFQIIDGEEVPLTRAQEVLNENRERALNSLLQQGAFLFADVFVAIIGFVLAFMVLPSEINRGVTLSILPKPLTRDEYVFGKALGIWVIVSGCFFILALELWGVQAIFDIFTGKGFRPDWHFLEAVILFPFKYATLILIIMGLTLRMPEVPAGIIGVIIFAVGHFSDRIFEIASEVEIPIMGFGLKFGYWVLPHMSQVTFSILDPLSTLITNWHELWGWVWQVCVYNIILGAMLSWLFRRRSL